MDGLSLNTLSLKVYSCMEMGGAKFAEISAQKDWKIEWLAYLLSVNALE